MLGATQWAQMGTNRDRVPHLGPHRDAAVPTKVSLCRLFFYGASETRTRDLLGAIQALSQLSYSPVRPRYRSGRDLQV